MHTQPDVDKLIQKTKRYEFGDGLRDIQLAVTILSLGIIIWFVFDRADVWLRAVIALKQIAGNWVGWTIVLVVLIPALLALVALPMIRRVRRRWLWRNSGIIRSKRWMVPRYVTLIAAVIVGLSLALGIALQRTASSGDFILLRVLIVASGWSLAYTLVEMGRKLDIPRYMWDGIIGGLASALLLLPILTVGQTALIWGVIWCGVLLASGVGPLLETLRKGQEMAHE